VAQALKDFARERATYYQKLEEEAVRPGDEHCAQGIAPGGAGGSFAADGIVRVALEKNRRLDRRRAFWCIPSGAPEWRRYLASRVDAGDLPEIVEDPSLRPEQCGLRTSMGTAELGLEVQLKEIEQGLMDLLAARPQGNR